MLIGIIGAMSEEVEALKFKMIIEESLNKAGKNFLKGKLWNKDVVVVVSGVGKVNAAMTTQILIDNFNVDIIINVGVAGGVSKDVKPGDIVIGTSLIQHDFDTQVFGARLGQISGLDTFDFKSDKNLIEKLKDIQLTSNAKVLEGIIVTGDQFICSKEKAEFLVKEFDAIASEMEGASIAHVSYLNKKPFVVIRSMSDNASTGATVEFEKFVNIAVQNSLEILEYLLKNI